MSKPFVFVSRVPPPRGMELIEEFCTVKAMRDDRFITRQEMLEGVVGVEGILCHPPDKVDKEVLDIAGKSLKSVSTMSVGLEHIDLTECKARGISVGYTPGVLTDATAETTVSLLLATSRRLKEAFSAVVDGGWGTWENGLYLCGKTLLESTVGIVGLGRIGLAVAKRLQPFGVQKFLYSGNTKKEWASEINAEFVSFERLLGESDFVIACCSMNKDNMGLFNKSAFSKMKNNAIFINTSRGVLVNQEDLYDALKSGTILAAGLDVTSPEPLPREHPLHTLKNCVITPHIGSATVYARNAMAELAAKNLIAGLKGKRLPSPVPQ
ncbi:glyoxylate reductase/hydroxypyruvate reductase [Magallana gigas]|uniref:Glyoxylate reductase/hydroxypyruvate reductase n=1 Tax=Magallana gigas TaxID=29159 RepID=K1P6I1_MAGGI|eukprot:XP_011449387.1 PREDICTED: glyoxylate reductase/hydroxypyruvate reductase [Crassostrea gigas]